MSSHSVEKRVALITGASGGIGRACVGAFVKAGWRISATALPGPELDRLSGADVLVLPGDVTSENRRREIVEHTLDHYQRIDALVNLAGVGLYGLPSSVPIDLMARLFEVNVLGALAMAQLVIPPMRRSGRGSIVNVGSVAGCVSLPWAAAYSASKFSLHCLDDALRRELHGDGIHVMNVSPGIVDTAFRENALAGSPPPRVQAIRCIVPPEAVAHAILKGIENRRRRVYVPRIGRLFRLLELFGPQAMDWYLRRFLPETNEMATSFARVVKERSSGLPSPADD